MRIKSARIGVAFLSFALPALSVRIARAGGVSEVPDHAARIYLAGAWGFSDFNVDKKAYEPYLDQVKGVKFYDQFKQTLRKYLAATGRTRTPAVR